MTKAEPLPDLTRVRHPSLSDLAWASWRIGLLGFGGPAGQIALMNREYVETRGWISSDAFLKALGFCSLLPGPEAQQLATWIGFRLHGVKGGLISGGLFILPGALLLLVLSFVYVQFGTVGLIAAALFGVKAAVLAVVIEASWKLAHKTLTTNRRLALAALTAVGLIVGVPFLLLILLAGLIEAFASPIKPRSAPARTDAPPTSLPQSSKAVPAAFVLALVWALPVGASFALLGPEHVLSAVAGLFSLLAIVSFGGAYAVLAMLQEQALSVQGWVTSSQMMDALGLAETTPGPLVLVNQFVGFLAGYQSEGGGLALAIGCALMASWCTFVPAFVWVFAFGERVDTLLKNPRLASALGGILAAIWVLLLALALSFAQDLLFPTSWSQPVFGFSLTLPDVRSINFSALVIALVSAAALFGKRLGPLGVVILSAGLGVAASFLA